MANLIRIVAVAILAATFNAALIAVAVAHPLAPSLLSVSEDEPGTATIVWKTPVNKVPGSDMRVLLPPQCRQAGVQTEETAGTAVVRQWRVACDTPWTGAMIGVEGIATSKADVVLRLDLADGRVLGAVLTADRPTYLVPERDGRGTVVADYLRLGAEHILSGPDHLLFVLGLLLLVSGVRQLVWTVTAFTLGHSVTLSAAVLGLVGVPPGPVEVLIALSILVVAAEAVRAPSGSRNLLRRFPWAIAFAFGLLHGFGFAGALAEIGLPAGEIPLALFSFNLGIEAGQLLFCAGILALYLAVRRFRHFPYAFTRRIAAYVIGTLAAYWVLDRAAATLAPLVA